MTDQIMTALNAVSERYDPAVAAGFYSQLCGVLAGFAFTGLVLVVTTRLGTVADGSAQGPSIGTSLSLLGAMVGLTVCSLSYAVAAADPMQASGLVAHVLAAVAFSTSAYAFIVAIHLLFVDYGLDLSVTKASRWTSVAVISLANIHLLGGLGEIADHLDSTLLDWARWIGCLVALIGAPAATWMFRKRTPDVAGSDPRSFVALLRTIIAVTIVTSGVGAFVAGNGLDDFALVSGFFALGAMVALSAAGTVLSIRLKVEY